MADTKRIGTMGIRWHAASMLATALALGCGAGDESRDFASLASALSICDEDVPAEHYVDGIPAYAQCAASENSAIYSSNGIDTSTTEEDGWYRTQYSGGYQCTELAHRYLYFVWNIDWIPRGNAGEWCDTVPPTDSGLTQTSVPVHGDIIVFAPGVCGAGADTGHVAVVDVVDDANARVTIVEQNRASRRTTDQSCATCFLHVVANDGSVPEGTGGTTGTGGQSSTGGSFPTGGATSTGGWVPTGGLAATGGLTTTGGSPATGGLIATGGATPVGGQTPTGGSSTGGISTTGGTTPSGDPPANSTGGVMPAVPGTGGELPGDSEPASAVEDDEGCACSTPTRRGNNSTPRLALVLLAFAAFSLRRRSHRRA